MPRPILAAAALAAAVLTVSPVQARPAAVLTPSGPPQPSLTAPQLPASPGAGWSCTPERCAYVKTSGAAWGNCFISWTYTHNAWRPHRYCH